MFTLRALIKSMHEFNQSLLIEALLSALNSHVLMEPLIESEVPCGTWMCRQNQ